MPEPQASHHTDASALNDVAEVMLAAFVGALSRRPDLTSKLRELLSSPQPAELERVPNYMSVPQYAAHRCVSERTIRYSLELMTEGVHFERAGRTRRRVVFPRTASKLD